MERKLKIIFPLFMCVGFVFIFCHDLYAGFGFGSRQSAGHRRPLVQKTHWEDYSGTGYTGGVSATLTKNITAGNFVLVYVAWGSTSTKPTQVSDGTNVFTEIAAAHGIDSGNGQWQSAYYYTNHPGGTINIAATWAGSRSYTGLQIIEYQRIDNSAPINAAGSLQQNTPGTAANAISSGSVSMTAAGVVTGFTQATVDLSGVVTAGSGFTKQNTSDFTAFEDKTENTTGTTSATFTTTSTSNSYVTSIVVLKLK